MIHQRKQKWWVDLALQINTETSCQVNVRHFCKKDFVVGSLHGMCDSCSKTCLHFFYWSYCPNCFNCILHHSFFFYISRVPFVYSAALITQRCYHLVCFMSISVLRDRLRRSLWSHIICSKFVFPRKPRDAGTFPSS